MEDKDIYNIKIIKKREVKSKKRKLTLKEQMNAEFKSLRLRIRRLEDIVLSQYSDSGSIKDPATKLKQG